MSDRPHPGLKAIPADKSDIYTVMRGMDLDRKTWMEEINRLADRLELARQDIRTQRDAIMGLRERVAALEAGGASKGQPNGQS